MLGSTSILAENKLDRRKEIASKSPDIRGVTVIVATNPIFEGLRRRWSRIKK